ncbi:glucose-6-phosphate isomerase [Ignicoccus pacificus DSM 13166]|uniref:glucose-6-phosphate isomerase n=1 Tax=Ignicoccus pacificus DSM 13166 TaxID=940294 RepID=A0A977PKH8_9CREN|nr:glucose-6-phosphate isomerase [Ignicoccus pacificus DSM 13166]
MAYRAIIDGFEFILDEGIAITPKGVIEGTPRTFGELGDVMVKKGEEGKVAYWMFRDVLPVPVGGLRGDVTLVLPGRLPSGEFIKTHGHYHPEGPWGRWPELYGVVKGEVLFILQDLKGRRVMLVPVREGELIMVPPGYGHVMVNHKDEAAITFNYVSRLFSSVYGPYKEKKGASVYVYPSEEGFRVVRNPNYEVEEVLWCKPLPLYIKEPILHLAFKPHEEEWFKCEERLRVEDFPR